MTSPDSSDLAAFEAELRRLDLDLDSMPGGGIAVGPGGAETLLARLRQLNPGATWHDVFPDLPAHWQAGKPETWTTPYRPLGPYDYQELPTGAAVHIYWDGSADPSRLHDFVSRARSAGWPIHGAGLLEYEHSTWEDTHAMVVLERDAPEDTVDAFASWVQDQSDVKLATIPRRGTEDYCT